MWTGQNRTAQMPTLCWPKRAPLMDTTRGTLCVALDAGLQCRSVRPCHPKGSEALVFVLVPSLQLKHNASPHFFFFSPPADCLIVRLWTIIKPSLLSYFFLAGYRKVNLGLAPEAF